MPIQIEEDDETYEEALERAIRIRRNHKDEVDRIQIESKLRHNEWEEVGRFAAMCCQCDALNLAPHQTPPCWINPANIEAILAKGNTDDPAGDYAAAVLLKRLLAAGLSRYEPNPLDALKAFKFPLANL
jgi:hypothetical protein